MSPSGGGCRRRRGAGRAGAAAIHVAGTRGSRGPSMSPRVELRSRSQSGRGHDYDASVAPGGYRGCGRCRDHESRSCARCLRAGPARRREGGPRPYSLCVPRRAKNKTLIDLPMTELRIDLTVILHLRAYALWGCSRFLMRMIVLYAVVSVSILMRR